MMYLFDLDDTLISGYMDSPTKDYADWHVLPRRRKIISELLQAGHVVAIVTNQGGVAFGYVDKAACDHKLERALHELGLVEPRWDGSPRPPLVFVCIHDVRDKAPYNDPDEAMRRKPSDAMIRKAIADYPRAAAKGVVYVGDREEDRAAADDAGVLFEWASR